MSLVDLDTGEIVDQLDEEAARLLTNRIRQCVAVAHESIVHAYKGRAWIALGHQSWDAYCDAEFGGARLPIPKADRSEVVALLRAEGLSTRAIASAIGVSKNTVTADLSQIGTPATVQGADGKTYPAQQPERADVSNLDTDDRGAGEADDREASGHVEPSETCPSESADGAWNPPAPEPAQHENEGAADECPPPAAHSAARDLLDNDAELGLLAWRESFTAKCKAVTRLKMFAPADVAAKADAEWLDDLAGIMRNLNGWWTEIEELRKANRGLRVVNGGAR